MVTALAKWLVAVACLAAIASACPMVMAQAPASDSREPTTNSPKLQIDRLDPASKAKVLSALAGLVILMFGLMALAWLGARWARSYGARTPSRYETRQKRVIDGDDWASKPLAPADPNEDSGESNA
jgi:hypothetical protein